MLSAAQDDRVETVEEVPHQLPQGQCLDQRMGIQVRWVLEIV